MEKSAGERHLGPRAEENDEKDAYADPGIDAEIKTGVGK
jgi:hypothetical protein